jgi:hypothetical protein
MEPQPRRQQTFNIFVNLQVLFHLAPDCNQPGLSPKIKCSWSEPRSLPHNKVSALQERWVSIQRL